MQERRTALVKVALARAEPLTVVAIVVEKQRLFAFATFLEPCATVASGVEADIQPATLQKPDYEYASR